MPSTVPKAFDEFAVTIKPTPTQEQTITARRGRVRRFLLAEYGPDSKMPLLDVTVIGSAGRKTMIRPVEDIDVFCVFERRRVWESYRHDSKQLLYRVREALDGYSVKTVGSRGQAVRLFYNDGILVDVTPAFRRQDFWGRDSGYIIPRGDGEWQPTDPFVHHQFMARRNEELGNNLKPLVRKLKRWNGVHSHRLSSFHLEMLVQATFGKLGSSTSSSARFFFKHAGDYLHVKDPAGYSGDLAVALTSQQQAAIKQSFTRGLDHAQRAQQAESDGNLSEAFRQWRMIFGDEFPPYTPPLRLNLARPRPR